MLLIVGNHPNFSTLRYHFWSFL